ncbi:MAG TPA: sugar nucleotide-binding protein [Clostridia bacterium]|nr:sugar nucleotide-binding protein [Clostridia bacterium]
MKVKVLGTGLSGLVGSRIVELLGPKFEFEDLALEKGHDITRLRTIEKKIASFPASFLIHLAAFTDVGAAWEENNNKTGRCYRINVEGTENIASLCAKYRKHLIHFSTDFVFGGESNEPYTEKDKPNPIDWYGKTKAWAEEKVKTSGCSYTIVRIAYPFRARYPAKTDLIRQLINGLRDKSLYPMFADKIITPTFVDDIAWGIGKILERGSEGIWHLTGSSFVSHYELAKLVVRTFSFDESLVKKGSLLEYQKSNPEARPYPRCLKIANQKAIRELGIEMKDINSALLSIKEQMKIK